MNGVDETAHEHPAQPGKASSLQYVKVVDDVDLDHEPATPAKSSGKMSRAAEEFDGSGGEPGTTSFHGRQGGDRPLRISCKLSAQRWQCRTICAGSRWSCSPSRPPFA